MSGALAFFGAFNPPTSAHLSLARLAMEETARDRVIFVPSQAGYIRGNQGKDFAFSDETRLGMLRAAASVRPWMAVCDWELRQPKQPRTYETLCHLRDGGDTAALLIGADKLPELRDGWRHVEEIAREFGIVCLTRGSDDSVRCLTEDAYLRTLAPYIRVVRTPQDTRQVSSTAVRQRLAALRSLRGELAAMVPPEIMTFLDDSIMTD